MVLDVSGCFCRLVATCQKFLRGYAFDAGIVMVSFESGVTGYSFPYSVLKNIFQGQNIKRRIRSTTLGDVPIYLFFEAMPYLPEGHRKGVKRRR